MPNAVLEAYKTLTIEAQQEVNDFIFFLIQRNSSAESKTVSSDVSSLRGSLSIAVDPSLAEKEKLAWTNAMKEKHQA